MSIMNQWVAWPPNIHALEARPPSTLVLRSSGLLGMRGLEGVDWVVKSEGTDANSVG